MNILLVYCSPNDTTRTAAILLEKAFQSYRHTVKKVDIGRSSWRENPDAILAELCQADVVGFGSPAYHMDFFQPLLNLFTRMEAQSNPMPIRAFYFLLYSGITSGKAFLSASRRFHQMKIPVLGAVKVLAPHFHHPLPFPTQETERLLQNFVNALENKSYTALSQNQTETLFKPFTRKIHWIHPFIHTIGKWRELPIHLVDSDCIQCGKCVRECPAGAIQINSHVQIHARMCLHCYHCAAACPQHAIRCPVEKLDDMMQMNIRLIGTENPANQFFS